MDTAKCFKALGFSELPESFETVEKAYEQKKGQCGETESGKLAARLLEENYRACLDWFAAKEALRAGEKEK
ncbi:MAG: hypothetical protein IKB53_02320 [Oscillospiraceae bacterium]|nr:hypothetical protein [Oscillospiraceae bacterium]